MRILKKILIMIITIAAAAAAAAAGGAVGMQKRLQELPYYMDNTTLNGESIAERTPEEIADEYDERFNTEQTAVIIEEYGEPSIKGTMKTAGYAFDRAQLEEVLGQAWAAERGNIRAMIETMRDGYPVRSEEAYTFDEKTFRGFVNAAALKVPRVETVDPSIEFDESIRSYYVKEGSEGNMIDDEILQSAVLTVLKETAEKGSLPETVTVAVPEEAYTSLPPKDNTAELQTECDARNLELRKQEKLAEYEAGSVTYTFGEETVTLSHADFKDWLSIDDELNVTIDEEAAKAYVEQLAETWDTQYRARGFQTTTGKTITFSGSKNEYGFRINKEAETAQLLADIESKEPVTRDPVYYMTNKYGNPYHYQRNGADDLAGNYVEVNLTRQHLWFYVGGQLIVESDLVSGSVARGKETQTGVFPLAYKESPRTLTGGEAGGSGSYTAHVQYWMPFYDGQGLHDAPWRGNFGGQIYKTSGSHGCVNLPPSVAKKIYENIKVGMAIIVYKE